MKIILSLLLVMFLMGGVFLVGNVVSADDPPPKTLVGEYNCSSVTCTKDLKTDIGKYCCGNYEISDGINLLITASNMVFGLIGSLVLLFFVYGGFLFLTSGGSKERVGHGKRVILGSVIGVLIVFFAYTVVGFIFAQLGIEGSFASSDWFKPAE